MEVKPAMMSLPKHRIVKRSNSRCLAWYTSVLDESGLEAMTPGWGGLRQWTWCGRFFSGQSGGISDLSGLWGLTNQLRQSKQDSIDCVFAW